MTRQQYVRMIQMVSAALNVSFQLKGCSAYPFTCAGGVDFEHYDNNDAAVSMVADLVTRWTDALMVVIKNSISYSIYAVGFLVMVALVTFLLDRRHGDSAE